MYSNLLTNISFVVGLFLFLLGTSETGIVEDTFHRSKRQLLFPNSTLLQFNAGIGMPTLADMINLNWAFQANFQLPWNRTQIPVDILHANGGYDGLSRKKRDVNSEEKGLERDGLYENDARLYHFYKYVEEALDSFGYNGTSCVLRTLCHIGAEPLHSEHEDDVLHELASYVLNPTNDISRQMSEKDESYPYIHAYQNGMKRLNCRELYKECYTDLIDMFTKRHEI